MHTRFCQLSTAVLLLALLAGCGGSSTSKEPGITTPILSEPALAINETLVPVSTMPAATPSSPTPSLPIGWRRVAWQSLSVPIPPDAIGLTPLPPTKTGQLYGTPVSAAVLVTFPPQPTPANSAIGEYPTPPILTLLQFSGTLDEWISLEEASIAGAEGGVEGPVEQLTIARQAARHYHRTVPGFNYNDHYVLKLTDTTLLLIYTDTELFRPMVDGLSILKP